MKQSMTRIISERPRSRTSCICCASAGGRLQREYQGEHAIRRYRSSDDLLVRSRRKSDPKNYGARRTNLRPLERWLTGQIGREWNEVWSEACAVADNRSHRGWTLRLHLGFLVETVPLRINAAHSRGFYVDPETQCLQFRHGKLPESGDEDRAY